MTEAGTVPAIEKSLQLASPPDRVWKAITDPTEIACWFGDSAELEPRTGEEGWFGWDRHGQFAVRVERCEPITRFAWRWARTPDVPLDESPSTLVEWTLTPTETGGTLLELRESGFADPAARRDNDGGWDAELGDLAGFLAG